MVYVINNNLLEQVQSIYEKTIEGVALQRLETLLFEIETGKRPKGGAETVGIPSIGAEKIERFGIYNYGSEKYINPQFFSTMKKGIVRSGDVLLYKDGAYTGKSSMALDGFPYEQCVINEHVFILRTHQSAFQSFLYCTLVSPIVKHKIEALAAGKAAQPGLNQEELKLIEVPMPNKDVITRFEELVFPLMKMVAQNALENRKISIARDTLLPKLMSGEIDVSSINL